MLRAWFLEFAVQLYYNWNKQVIQQPQPSLMTLMIITRGESVVEVENYMNGNE